MIRKIAGRKRIFLLAAVGSLLFILSILSYLYFGEEQIQSRIKEQICNKVIGHEDELSEIVKKVPIEETVYFKKDAELSIQWVYYKELDDERIDKVFKDFHLTSIDKSIDESVDFSVKSTVVSILWNNYMCGFYYTKNDKPMNMWSGKELQKNELEDEIEGFAKYWYRTEKITDNWWLYEIKLYVYPASHRG